MSLLPRLGRRARLAVIPAAISAAITAAFCFPIVPLTVAVWAQNASAEAAHAVPVLRTLIVGGGPDLSHNQAAIESNVRYVDHLLPRGAPRRILFANGNPHAKNVLCEDSKGNDYFRAPNLPAIDGPARMEVFQAEMRKLAVAERTAPSPVLLYFTGHGSPDRSETFDDNRYELWGREELSVRRLSAEIAALPPSAPVTVVMVQCFSGAFGNLLFVNGDPHGQLADRTICGFFASVPSRMAAGCTPEVDETDYHDFTGYFFAALSGTDRMGRKAPVADYDNDGRVGMNEAFAYALIHDESIDTPVCTSDVFLRRFVKAPDTAIFHTPYTVLHSYGTPAQQAALDALSEYANLKGEDRLADAYSRLKKLDSDSEEPEDVHLIRFVRLAKSVGLAHILQNNGDAHLQARFAALLRAESGNPLQPAQSATKP